MNQSPVKQQFMSLLDDCDVAIAYSPLEDEIDFKIAPLPSRLTSNALFLPKNSWTDPESWASTCLELLADKSVCIFIPGTAFDMNGTRHGRGGGWYDRFLSKVPRKWLRVGITDTQKLSPRPLERMPWDEPVDFILAFNGMTSSWQVHAFKNF